MNIIHTYTMYKAVYISPQTTGRRQTKWHSHTNKAKEHLVKELKTPTTKAPTTGQIIWIPSSSSTSYILHIFSRFLNFVFGVADLSKNKSFGSAIISVTRLREEFYRRTVNIALFEQRVLKEAIHELGHTFGLEHCENLCVMRFSNSLEDTDRKPQELCETCLKKLEDYLNSLNLYQNF